MQAVGNKAGPLKTNGTGLCLEVVYVLKSQIQVLQELLANLSKIHSNNVFWKFPEMGQDTKLDRKRFLSQITTENSALVQDRRRHRMS